MYLKTHVTVQLIAITCALLSLLGQTVAIYKGRKATQGELPYQLGLKQRESSEVFCGATLISVDGVQLGLASANCTNVRNITVGGDVLVGPIGSNFQQVRNASDIVLHPNYSNETLENNIALLFFEPFELNENTQPAKVPQPNQQAVDITVTVSGWGSAADFNDPEQWLELNVVNMTSITDASCKEYLTAIGSTITERMMCAQAGGKPNHRDNGGPAVTTEGYVVGIFSLNLNQTDVELPSVFMEVSYYRTWIEDTVQSYKNGWTTPKPESKSTSTPKGTNQKDNGAPNHQKSMNLFQISVVLLISLQAYAFIQ